MKCLSLKARAPLAQLESISHIFVQQTHGLAKGSAVHQLFPFPSSTRHAREKEYSAGRAYILESLSEQIPAFRAVHGLGPKNLCKDNAEEEPFLP